MITISLVAVLAISACAFLYFSYRRNNPSALELSRIGLNRIRSPDKIGGELSRLGRRSESGWVKDGVGEFYPFKRLGAMIGGELPALIFISEISIDAENFAVLFSDHKYRYLDSFKETLDAHAIKNIEYFSEHEINGNSSKELVIRVHGLTNVASLEIWKGRLIILIDRALFGGISECIEGVLKIVDQLKFSGQK